MATAQSLRDEARTCRELIREVKDPASIMMLRDRAEQLEAKAARLERHAGGLPVPAPNAIPKAAIRRPSRRGDLPR